MSAGSSSTTALTHDTRLLSVSCASPLGGFLFDDVNYAPFVEKLLGVLTFEKFHEMMVKAARDSRSSGRSHK